MEELFMALTEFPFLLPHTNIFVIHLHHRDVADISNTFCEALNHVLITHYTQIQVFHFILLRDLKMPTPDMITAFRELAVDGVHVNLTAGVWDHTFD
jgi:hypothetical protein